MRENEVQMSSTSVKLGLVALFFLCVQSFAVSSSSACSRTTGPGIALSVMSLGAFGAYLYLAGSTSGCEKPNALVQIESENIGSARVDGS